MKRWNWLLWTGLVLSLVAFASYFLVFARWPVTRDVPWVNFLLFIAAMAMLVAGVRRALVPPATTTRKIISIFVASIGLTVFVLFASAIFMGTSRLPASAHAPAPGQKAPEFTLLDSNRRPVALSQLVAGSPRGVLLIFYRGYW